MMIRDLMSFLYLDEEDMSAEIVSKYAKKECCVTHEQGICYSHHKEYRAKWENRV